MISTQKETERSDVLILGAGAAGLMAAAQLRQAGIEVAILEARDRIGGRLLTVEDPELPFPLDLGAEFVHGLPQRTVELAHRFHVPVYEVTDRHLFQESGKLAELPDFWERIGRVLGQQWGQPGGRKARTAARSDRSLLESLNSRKVRGRDRKLALTFVEGFHAADPRKLSEKAIARETRGASDIHGDHAYRLWGGYAALLEGLLIGAEGARIHFETVVDQVSWDRGQVTVRASDGKIFQTRTLICTLPPGPLSHVRFEPGLPPAKAQALSQIENGPVLKLLISFKEAFWEKKLGPDLSFLHSSDVRYFPTWWTTAPIRSPILTGWTGGPAASELSSRDPGEISEIALQSLSRILKVKPSFLLERAARIFWHDWIADPFSMGAYSYLTVGGTMAPSALAKPVLDTLFFAGEAAESSGVTGTVEGALQSGARAAQEVLKAHGRADERAARESLSRAA